MPRSLLVVPMPFADETPCSWLTRLAQMHAATPLSVLAAVGVRTFVDTDIEMTQDHFAALLYGTDTVLEDVPNLLGAFRIVREQGWVRAFLRRICHAYPCTAICRQCLAEDVTPYWRIEWRSQHWQVCPKHFCRLEDTCAACKRCISIFPHSGGKDRGEHHLGHCCICPHCGTDLVAGDLRFVQKTDEVFRLIELQRAVMAALVQGYVSIEGIEEPLPLAVLPRALMMGCIASPLPAYVGRKLYPQVRTDVLAEAHDVEFKARVKIFQRGGSHNRIREMGDVWKGTPGQLVRIVIRHRFESVADRVSVSTKL